jgi:hypothetical protein
MIKNSPNSPAAPMPRIIGRLDFGAGATEGVAGVGFVGLIRFVIVFVAAFRMLVRAEGG